MARQKRMAVINDFSGFGRCSLTVSLPVISAMRIQCCPVPTAILSNHTGYDHYFFDDYTDKMRPYCAEWEQLGLTFDGIYTGFLGSVRQVEIISDFIQRFSSDQTAVIVDPVMGDNGAAYDTFSDELCSSIRKLIPLSDIITPNLTEACILADIPFREDIHSENDLLNIADSLRKLGSKQTVITGIEDGSYINCFIYEDAFHYQMVRTRSTGTRRAGTGDFFSSLIAGDRVNGKDIYESVGRAAELVRKSVVLSDEMKIPCRDGVCFEELMNEISLAPENCRS